MTKRDLVIHLPVIHKGFIDFFHKKSKEIGMIYILDEKFLTSLSDTKPDIASIDSQTAKNLLEKMGFTKVSILKRRNINQLGYQVLLVDDEVSRSLKDTFLVDKDIKWERVFLRWDKSRVSSPVVKSSRTSKRPFDKKMMKQAYLEADKSSDWWRQVGAVLVKNKKIILKSYNVGVPTDHSPYQVGAIRDLLEVGQNPELSSTIHAEQTIIATAAKRGISLEGTFIYITHFPCSICAKLIAYSGIKKCYFGESSSNLDGQNAMKSKGVDIFMCKQ
jgi:dCMP deaminase